MENFFERNNTQEQPASPEDFEKFTDSVGPKMLEASKTFDKLALAGEAKEKLKKFMKFTFTRVLPVYMAYIGAGHFLQKEDGTFSERERAKKELAENGITSEQVSTYKLGINDLIYRGIAPTYYGNSTDIKSFAANVFHGREEYSFSNDVYDHDPDTGELLK